jgi:hypothetical protein
VCALLGMHTVAQACHSEEWQVDYHYLVQSDHTTRGDKVHLILECWLTRHTQNPGTLAVAWQCSRPTQAQESALTCLAPPTNSCSLSAVTHQPVARPSGLYFASDPAHQGPPVLPDLE